MKFEQRCCFYLLLIVTFLLIFHLMGGAEQGTQRKKCATPGLANQSLHRWINTQPIDKFILHRPSAVAHREYRLIFLVISAVYEVNERAEIRRTWAARSGESRTMENSDALVIFVVGRSSLLETEAREHKDLLQVDLEDTYRNMVYKIEAAYRYVRERLKSEFVVKVDSDTVVHIDRLYDQLTVIDQTASGHWMTCFIIRNSLPVRDSCDNWFLPEEDYPAARFPDYCNGPGYVMKRGGFDRIVDKMGSVKVIEIEDVFFTGQVAAGVVDLHCADHLVVHLFTEYSQCPTGTPTLSMLPTHYQFGDNRSLKNLTAAYARLKDPYCESLVAKTFFSQMVFNCKA